jgi:hypothetical protein
MTRLGQSAGRRLKGGRLVAGNRCPSKNRNMLDESKNHRSLTHTRATGMTKHGNPPSSPQCSAPHDLYLYATLAPRRREAMKP